MILLAYMLLGHPDRRHAQMCIFAALPRRRVAEQRPPLKERITSRRHGAELLLRHAALEEVLWDSATETIEIG
ncbi:MAG: hypothetical protein ACE5JR_06115 [Gemmatimonadota bacterium]